MVVHCNVVTWLSDPGLPHHFSSGVNENKATTGNYWLTTFTRTQLEGDDSTDVVK